MMRYELKKIFLKPVNKIVFLILFIVTITAGLLTIRDVRYLKENGEHISGTAAARELKKAKNAWRGELTEDLLKQVIKENEKMRKGIKPQEKYENESDYWNAQDAAFQKTQGIMDIKLMISRAFSDPDNYDYYKADNVKAGEVGAFYECRVSNLKKWLDTTEEHYSFAQKKFLIGQYEKLKTPFFYEYADGWKALLDSQYLPTLMTIIVVIIGFFVAGIFSDEFQYKADSIFFSSKLGRGRAVGAKLGAGFVTVTAVYWGAVGLYTLFVLCTLGFGGAGCAIQTGNNWESFYNISYLQELLLTAIGGYIGSLFILILAMLVSAKSRSTVFAITIPFALSCVPMFLGRVPLLTRIMTLFPDQLLRVNKVLEDFILYEIGGRVIGYIFVCMVLYLVLSVVLLPVVYGVYKRTQIK